MKLEFVRVSDISALMFCQRYCYFNLIYRDVQPVEINAMREIYFSRRAGINNWTEWAKKRFFVLYGKSESTIDLFERAKKEFVYSEELYKFKSIETEVNLKREDIMLTGLLDEIVEVPEKLKKPLILSYKAPEDGVWYRDRIRLAAFCILLEDLFKCGDGFVYYCSGELRGVEISRKDKHAVIKAIERVNKLKKGFLPEKLESKKCKNCKYRSVCEEKGETFASKFL
ncbi:MAG: hypothetical protein DSY33_04235 [Archaeoglobus sp.]|nr:MAG: hypothetical protein DSY33_04235 [Archaeoglobus sp.]